ncbi:hypothetical protein D0862_03536 [Hortaea werneckii]|uniref:Fork-head domain-containing protein n=1 Tax=Hortaea werneckii TaxID=91943 RepID=A0A3M7H8N2_HORWE|nr:hypothetical protein D0862_03536 [Hortaea werneckii]
MESSGAGALAAQAAPLPTDSHHTPDPLLRLTAGSPGADAEVDWASGDMMKDASATNDGDENLFLDLDTVQPQGPSLETPVHAAQINHFEPSNLRESTEDQQQTRQPSPTSTDAAKAADILANTTNGFPATDDNEDWMQMQDQDATNFPQWDPSFEPLPDAGPGDLSDDAQWLQGDSMGEAEPPPKSIAAYARLTFPDGDYFISTFEVMLGRDMDFWRRYARELKRARRAQHDLDEYRLEPSQPSQPDEGGEQDPSSKSSHSLEGRPAKGLPSNFSEQGGAVSFAPNSDEEGENRRSRRKKRRILNSKSSSATSVAPASLHPSLMGSFNSPNPFSAEAGAVTDQPSQAFVPVHPQRAEDIKKISKEHLLFRYNFQEETWEVLVMGPSAMINDSYHRRDEVVRLSRHDHIVIAETLAVDFKLPDAMRTSPGPSRGTFTSDGEEDFGDLQTSPLGTSPIRRLSKAMVDVDSDDDEALPLAKMHKKPKPKLKLSLKKKKPDQEKTAEDTKEQQKAGKTIAKPKKQEKEKKDKEVAAEKTETTEKTDKSPETANKAAEAGSVPNESAQETPVAPVAEPVQLPVEMPTIGDETLKPEEQELHKLQSLSQMSPPAQPPVIEPGSIFEGVAPEELPQKRKGPGRPPKNGLISKRDQALVKRKQKEYEKRGQLAPGLDELVAMVRAETKAKEAAAKAAARGEAPPEIPIMQSIEADALPMPLQPSAEGAPSLEGMLPKTSATPMDPTRRASSPKPKRLVKSPSPMKPEHEYTEEEMKKPTITYVHILDEVLRDHPIGKADLQELYDRICKRYPYFKYKTGTSGWQSSVRHNLLQHERFKEDGRSGKGRLWAINWDYPLEKEKKRRVTPPPRPAYPPMQNGQYAPMPYGAPYAGAPYGQQTVNGQPAPPPNFSGPPQPGGPNAYYSPYAPGQYPAPNQPQQPMQPGQQAPGATVTPSQTPRPPQQVGQNGTPNSQPPPQQQQQQQRQPSAQPAPQFQGIVDEIMAYRSSYLAAFQPDTEAFKHRDELFKKCTNYMSNIFHGTGEDAAKGLSDEEKPVYDHLQAIFNKYQHLKGPPGSGGSQKGTPTPAPEAAKGPAPAAGAQTGPAQHQTWTGQGQPPPQQPPSAPPQAQPTNANVAPQQSYGQQVSQPPSAPSAPPQQYQSGPVPTAGPNQQTQSAPGQSTPSVQPQTYQQPAPGQVQQPPTVQTPNQPPSAQPTTSQGPQASYTPTNSMQNAPPKPQPAQQSSSTPTGNASYGPPQQSTMPQNPGTFPQASTAQTQPSPSNAQVLKPPPQYPQAQPQTQQAVAGNAAPHPQQTVGASPQVSTAGQHVRQPQHPAQPQPQPQPQTVASPVRPPNQGQPSGQPTGQTSGPSGPVAGQTAQPVSSTTPAQGNVHGQAPQAPASRPPSQAQNVQPSATTGVNVSGSTNASAPPPSQPSGQPPPVASSAVQQGQSAPSQAAPGQPARSQSGQQAQSAPSQPVPNQSVQGQSVQGQPAPSQPAQGQAAPSQSVQGPSASTQPAPAQPAPGQTAPGQPGPSQPAQTQPAAAGQSAQGQSAQGQLGPSQPAQTQPAPTQPTPQGVQQPTANQAQQQRTTMSSVQGSAPTPSQSHTLVGQSQSSNVTPATQPQGPSAQPPPQITSTPIQSAQQNGPPGGGSVPPQPNAPATQSRPNEPPAEQAATPQVTASAENEPDKPTIDSAATQKPNTPSNDTTINPEQPKESAPAPPAQQPHADNVEQGTKRPAEDEGDVEAKRVRTE